ncbi:hypothetical protein [Methanobrevibacter sp.]|jgi:hypothetical protein|uniref:hypothetical protein n=1 Tax=Methanobrevibacter sp. TaxID=66852 RepID=UPI0038908CE0
MADDIIDIEDYEVKDTQIVETSDEDDYKGQYNQREYDNQGATTGFYKSFSLNNTSLLIIGMVVLLLVVIFIMTFD